jgi:hypothetical protein
VGKLAIGVGSAANDGTGDLLRTAFQKCNGNFDELYASVIPTRASFAALTVPAAVDAVRTNGYALVGDGGDALYKRVAVQPSHAGKVQSADGAWWELAVSDMANVRAFGAVGDAATNDTTAINNAAVFCRAKGVGLLFPSVANYYLISAQIDLRDIYHIQSVGAVIAGTFSAITAVLIGSNLIDMYKADIYIDVWNIPDKTTVAATRGIGIGNLSDSICHLGVRGFYDGVYFDGTAGTNVWTGNVFNILRFYNNNNHITANLTGYSYIVQNRFVGGKWYLGTRQTIADCGTFSITTADTAELSNCIIENAEIGIDGQSIGTGHAAFLTGNFMSSSNLHSFYFRGCRFETYAPLVGTLYGVNVQNLNGDVLADIGLNTISDVGGGVMPHTIPLGSNVNIIVRDTNGMAVGGVVPLEHVFTVPPIIAHQNNDKIYVPGKVLFDSSHSAPSQHLTYGLTSRTSRAIGDNSLIIGGAPLAVGEIYRKTIPDYITFGLISDSPKSFIIICYDAAGNVLSGTAPMYANGSQWASGTYYGVGEYRFLSNWFWIHQNVDHFFIGESSHYSPQEVTGIKFRVTAGSPLVHDRRMATCDNRICANPTMQCVMPVGTEVYNFGGGLRYRSDFCLETTLSTGAALGAGSVTVTNGTGVHDDDVILIELDTAIITPYGGSEYSTFRQYHYTTVASAAGTPTLTLTDVLPDTAASGRKVRIGRWATI